MHWPTSAMSASSVSSAPERLAGDEARERLLLAHRADAARDALAARLVAEEGGDPLEEPRQVDGVVEDEDDARAERRSGRAGALERERHVEVVGAEEAAGGPAHQHRLQRPPARDAAGEIEHLAQRRPEAHLVRARARDVAREAEELRPGRALGADLRERRAGAEHDVEHVDERLDVVHDGRLSEEADLDGERRLVARLAALALDRLEDRRLLAADVGARRRAGSRRRTRSPRPSRPRRGTRARGPPRARARARAAPPGTRRGGRGSPARSRSRRRRSSSPRPPRTDRPPSARGP